VNPAKSYGLGNALKDRRCTLEELAKLLSSVKKSGAHWLFNGNTKPYGWGKLWFRGKWEYVHRVFFLVFRGRVPAGWDVHHRKHCRIRNCVNPWHLSKHPHADHTKITNGGAEPPLPF
jgi:hypothetical protein